MRSLWKISEQVVYTSWQNVCSVFHIANKKRPSLTAPSGQPTIHPPHFDRPSTTLYTSLVHQITPIKSQLIPIFHRAYNYSSLI